MLSYKPCTSNACPTGNPRPPFCCANPTARAAGVRKRTLANLTKWPDEIVRGLRILLRGGVALRSMDDAFEILRSRPHGHVAAVPMELSQVMRTRNARTGNLSALFDARRPPTSPNAVKKAAHAPALRCGT